MIRYMTWAEKCHALEEIKDRALEKGIMIEDDDFFAVKRLLEVAGRPVFKTPPKFDSSLLQQAIETAASFCDPKILSCLLRIGGDANEVYADIHPAEPQLRIIEVFRVLVEHGWDFNKTRGNNA